MSKLDPGLDFEIEIRTRNAPTGFVLSGTFDDQICIRGDLPLPIAVEEAKKALRNANDHIRATAASTRS